mgnify:CR=1 FL=1
MLTLIIASIGHAAWDNILHWMVKEDPDASLIHMHGVRMFIVSIVLSIVNREQPSPHTIYWWLKFSMVGWVVPALSYSICVLLSGYRIAISLQPLIPLFVALNTRQMLIGKKLVALNLALLGTLAIWLIAPWTHCEIQLWQIWGSLCFGIIQVIATVIWFSMLEEEMVDNRKILPIFTRGVQISFALLLLLSIVCTPQHLNIIYINRWDNWFGLIVASAVTMVCKLYVIAQCTHQMPIDAVAIFECLHPVATLCCDIVLQNETFEYDDSIAIILLSLGWILYPKTNT